MLGVDTEEDGEGCFKRNEIGRRVIGMSEERLKGGGAHICKGCNAVQGTHVAL